MVEIRVWLVGAGPGDPELLTVKAMRLISQADIILHDALVTPEILALAGRNTVLIPVGKRAGAHSMPQPAINAALVAAARGRQRVVRLKGGDPTIFGRLAEEMDALRRANIAFEVVPGVTAACAAAATAQVSLSQRGHAQGVTFVTGHARVGATLALDWTALAQPGTTLAIYMGKGAAAELQQALAKHGMAPATPVVAVENAGRIDQAVHRLTLATLENLVALAGAGPLLILVGSALADNVQPCVPAATLVMAD